MTEEQKNRVMLMASAAGFQVLPDGFVAPPRIDQSMRQMLLDFAELLEINILDEQMDRMEDDGK